MNHIRCRCSTTGGCRYFAPRTLAALLTAATLAVFAKGEAPSGNPSDDVPEQVEAQALFLTDAQGNRRGGLGINGEQEPTLYIADAQGATRVTLALVNAPETPHHALLNLTCQDQYAELGVNDEWKSYVHLTDQAGNLRLAISTGAQRILENARTDWGNEAWSTVLSLAPTGAVRCVFVATPEGGVCEVYNEAQQCVLRAGAGAKSGKPLPPLPAPVRAFTASPSSVPPKAETPASAQSASQENRISNNADPESAASTERGFPPQGRGPVVDQKKQPKVAEQGFVSLFDGKSLAGWHANGAGKWTVEAGAIVGRLNGESAFGHLVSNAEYTDFVLRAKFMVLGNSGVYVRGAESAPDGMAGLQVELLTPARIGNLLEVVNHPSTIGMRVEYPRDRVRNYFRPEDWNDLTITVRGSHVDVLVNRVKTAETSDYTRRSRGKVALQLCHVGADRTEVRFANVEIQELRAIGKQEPDLSDQHAAGNVRAAPEQQPATILDSPDASPTLEDDNRSLRDSYFHDRRIKDYQQQMQERAYRGF